MSLMCSHIRTLSMGIFYVSDKQLIPKEIKLRKNKLRPKLSDEELAHELSERGYGVELIVSIIEEKERHGNIAG